ncbi:extensin-1-like isoform X1 [Juglans microcarpa x Juglans regia]|uniref:extensin-1-like isoform X1 n=1 Tax=Juglans microcarpa x Juglans regia TaxID=2249226 RepID=UPI001B7E2A5D|nr:extensin-1-like isoform X1 [Juglans microcarpa x Juglans regia]
MAINRDSTIPPPMIGKIGPYTVFMTPPSTPKPSQPPVLDSPKKIFTPPPVLDSPKKIFTPPLVLDSPKKIITPPPVQPPPHQFHKSTESVASNGSVLGFFKNAATKVQNAHSSLDGHLARWFGLNQSKYQWALDDYYESKGSEKGEANAKDIPSKAQSV